MSQVARDNAEVSRSNGVGETATDYRPRLRRLTMVTLISNDGRKVFLVTCTDTREGWWGRPVGACVRFFFSRSMWRYALTERLETDLWARSRRSEPCRRT